jgi:hypothetical protein
MTGANETAISLLNALAAQNFWGELTLKIQRGQVVHITKQESIQPVPNNRRPDDQHSN